MMDVAPYHKRNVIVVIDYDVIIYVYDFFVNTFFFIFLDYDVFILYSLVN